MRFFTQCIFALILVGMLAACTTTRTGSSQNNTGQSPEAQYQEPDYYLDFDDIMIPKEIDYVNDGSYKLDNAKFRASIMKFKGRVEILELVQYFINNMTKDNWTLISSNKASSIHIMNFEKFNKSCVIQIDDAFASATTTIFAVEVKDASGVKSK
ncbi:MULTISPECIES: hypothetical protein [unclassified Pseudodesulfovibrio]|uniref:hypothetical protein n=1 Tax=unclassified Pseudodesulfovibrio TaxID=2661612 RepID=UPI000FEB688A|nr:MULTISPECIES: hypothetical protein [unclassified Pseudodesulfovibrio]MCJ2165162.1 hypothetical protein [Pseudodesulfovibrio sp. S3-i]RWU03386.1 hypothetical protein DWB63_11230 [Pseudodesulfovibrio sp. S3]